MTLIPAGPGWRVLVWERSNGEVLTLPIVAWEDSTETIRGFRFTSANAWPESDPPPIVRRFLRPWVQTAFGEEVSPYDFEDQSALFVGILAPRDKRRDWEETAHQVAKAADKADEREERKLREASS